MNPSAVFGFWGLKISLEIGYINTIKIPDILFVHSFVSLTVDTFTLVLHVMSIGHLWVVFLPLVKTEVNAKS